MANDTLKYCATDKEIYDLLMSARLRIGLEVLHNMATQRGIFYSPRETREDLANQLSLLPYDYEALDDLLVQSANPNRAEKVTSLTLNGKVTKDEVKELLAQLQSAIGPEEKVSSYSENPQTQLVQYEYTEIDFSKTRLLQRRERESDIRIITESDKTVIRMPANERTRNFVRRITRTLEEQRLNTISANLIEITDLPPDARTLFFTELISKMDGFSLRNVTKVDVHHGVASTEDEEDEEDSENEDETEVSQDPETAEAAEEMLSVVEDVALHGQMLMSSPEYQQLRQKGFYITSITWISQQNYQPYNRVEFEAGFEQPNEGKGFRYNIRGIYRKRKTKYTKNRKPVNEEVKQSWFPIIERTSREILAKLQKKSEPAKATLGATAES